jgi:acetyl esterase/lipase
MWNRLAAIISLVAILGACATVGSRQGFPGVRSQIATVTYCGAMKMDILGRRTDISAQATILYVHGGGWETGDRKSGFEMRRIRPLTRSGFIVASIDYRLAPAHKHPAQIHDVKCAIRYLRSHAPEFGIDPDRIGIMGDSAGGHLAALAGLTGSGDGLEGLAVQDVSDRINAVATFYGIFDLVNIEPSLAQDAVPKAFPTRADRVAASPVLYVDKDDPPFLIMHGKQDRFVDVAQSVKLAIILKNAGHSPLLVAVENADHGFVAHGGTPSPNSKALDQLLVAFFTEHLR